MKIVKPSAELVWITPYAASIIESAGRICYKSEGSEGYAFIRRLIAKGHESVLEHASASFKIVCDRGVSHEIVRHRLASYSQESTRYCNYSKEKFGSEIAVIEPPGLEDGGRYFWEHAMLAAEGDYLDLIGLGISPQIARSVLPTCLKTVLEMTANFREWRHFLKLRTAKEAHPQIVEVARMIGAVLSEKVPSVFEEWA